LNWKLGGGQEQEYHRADTGLLLRFSPFPVTRRSGIKGAIPEEGIAVTDRGLDSPFARA
jgi:hypothetical protein